MSADTDAGQPDRPRGPTPDDPGVHEGASENGLQYATYADIMEAEADADAAFIQPPRTSSGLFPTLSVISQWRKRKKVAKKGYVQWYLVDGNWPEPRYVKPKRKGGGIRELEHKGHRYLFPESAMVPSALEGCWTVVHRTGEADPISLRQRDPYERPALPADTVNDYVTSKLASSPPSWFDKFDLDAKTIFRWGIILIIAYAVFMQVAGGGLF